MNLPLINIAGCHDAAADCADERDVSLILKPERVNVCPAGSLQFAAFIRTQEGELAITQGLLFQSSNAAVVTIDAISGLANIIAAGSAIISVAWQNLMAFASVTVTGTDSSCCATTTVAIEVVIDVSRSMQDPLNSIFSKLDAAKAVAKVFTNQILIAKDSIGLARFNTNFHEVLDLGSVLPDDGYYAQIKFTQAATSILAGLHGAIHTLAQSSASQRVIVLFSDGDNRPRISDEDRDWIVELAGAFKNAGGIVIVVGVRAFGSGFDLLQKIASAGFFLNIYGEVADPVNDAATILSELTAYFCADATPATDLSDLYYAELYDPSATTLPLGAQLPDPLPLHCEDEP
jgi:hypothetical protein